MKSLKKHPVRRLIKAILWAMVAALLFCIVSGWAPFAVHPQLDGETAAAIEARALEMQIGTDTADRAAILETRTEALDERIRLMNRAQREIIIANYDCRDGESTRDLLAVALARADAGVKVRLLVDGVAGRMFMMPGELFRAVAAHPSVEIRFYNLLCQYTPWKNMGRMHDKYVIVDDLAYILGGRNMFDYFIGEYPAASHSLDREALIYNGSHGTDAGTASSLYQVRDYFEGVWNHGETTPFDGASRIDGARRDAVYAELSARYDAIRAEKPSLFEPFDYAAATDETRGVWLVSNPTTVYAKQPVVFTQLCELMTLAERDVVIHSPYAVLDGGMRAALSEIASKVPVTLMVNALGTGANVVAGSDYLYHRNDVLSTGVVLLEKCTGDSYHGKAIAIDDDIAVIGSFNLDLRSVCVDTELMLVIRSEAVNASLRRNMEALHADCRTVDRPEQSVVSTESGKAAVPGWKLAAMYVLGAILQPFRNLL